MNVKIDVILKFGGLLSTAGVRYFLGALLNGSTQIVNTGSFPPLRFFELVERFKMTMTCVIASTTLAILQHPGVKTVNFNSIRLWSSSGSNISLQLIQKNVEIVKKNFNFIILMGFPKCLELLHAI